VQNDIPSPIDLKDPAHALQWVRDTVERRPYRVDFFRAFGRYLEERLREPSRVLEIGSGPGHLAAQLLARVPSIVRYTLLDSSDAMHGMARQELRLHSEVTRFVTADFRNDVAFDGLRPFDVIVTMQAVHELRHKRHVRTLYQRLSNVMAPDGHFLVCDHTTDNANDTNLDLFMTREEQQLALSGTGFDRIEPLLDCGGMTLYAARKPRN
jgi:SAM-dependent methyltransferase